MYALYNFHIHDRIDRDVRLRGIILICAYLNRLRSAREIHEKSGESHIVSRGIFPSDGLLNWMITWLLEDVVEGSFPMPEELAELIMWQLPGVSGGFLLDRGDNEKREEDVTGFNEAKDIYGEKELEIKRIETNDITHVSALEDRGRKIAATISVVFSLVIVTMLAIFHEW